VKGATFGVRHDAVLAREPHLWQEGRVEPGRLIGIDLGGTKIEGVVLDELHAVCARVRLPTERERGYEHILGRIAEVVSALRPAAPEATCVGIGTPGSLSVRDGRLKNSNTTCLNGQPLHADLEARLGISVRLENDANCFALAEARAGAGRGHAMVFGVILGTGVGGGIVHRGELWAGPQHVAGEWGHHAIDPAGPACYCGQRGCVETLLAGPALEAAYRAAGGAPRPAVEIATCAAADEPAAAAVMDRYLDHFGRALANVIAVLDPDVVVLGGGLSNLETLYTRGRVAVARYVFNDELRTPIVRNQLGDSAGVLGAALLTAALRT
jgi:fructokinase